MIQLDLITGFLGSGKTTFIKQYARYLLDQGQKIAILENDYGAINIDLMMLKELEGPNCDLEMVVGGNDYDCHKRRLKSKLIALGMMGYDRVIMEPSGIFDADEYFDLLHEEPLDRWYEAGSVIALVEATLSHPISDETAYLLVSQTADAGIVLFSKCEQADEQGPERASRIINDSFRRFRCQRTLIPGKDTMAKPFQEYTSDDYRRITKAGVALHDHIRLPVIHANGYDSLFYMNVDLKGEDIRPRIQALLQDESVGQIIRVKGYVKQPSTDETQNDLPFLEINATKEEKNYRRAADGQEVIIVIGEHLNREKIASYWEFEYGTGKQLLT